jgi:small subunit ribosomal protein S8
MVNYTVSDMITRLRNAIRVKKTKVILLSTNLTKSITEILKREGYIEESYEVEQSSDRARANTSNENQQKELHLFLKYEGKKMIPALTNLKCISRPGVRFYANAREIPQVLGGLGMTIVSTSKGILTDTEARKLGVGGEVLCMIW